MKSMAIQGENLNWAVATLRRVALVRGLGDDASRFLVAALL